MSKVARLYQDSEEGRKRIEHHEKILISKDWHLFLILFGLRVRVVSWSMVTAAWIAELGDLQIAEWRI